MNLIFVNKEEDVRQGAISLWRQGRYAEARYAYVREALDRDLTTEGTIILTINLAIVERSDGRCAESLELLLEISALVESYISSLIKGKYYNALAATYSLLQMFDPAFEAYTAASIYYEKSKEFSHNVTGVHRAWQTDAERLH